MKKILIIQTAFLGDIILATSLVEKIIKSEPGVSLDFLLRKGNESVLNGHPHIETVYILDKKKKIKSLLNIVKKVRRKKYDLIINLHRFGSSGIVAFLSNAREVYGFDKNPFSFFYTKKVRHLIGEEPVIHEVDRNALLVSDLYGSDRVQPKLYVSKDALQKVGKFKKEKYVCIAPGSVWFTKRYPEEKWVDLINKIPREFSVYLLGAPNESRLSDEIQSAVVRDGVLNLAGKLSILESAALMKDAVMNFVNDSAPMHIASAVNAPVCAIYCSTVPAFGFGPLSKRSFIVEYKENLPCRPCNLHGKKECPEGHFNCANRINTSSLLEVLNQVVVTVSH